MNPRSFSLLVPGLPAAELQRGAVTLLQGPQPDLHAYESRMREIAPHEAAVPSAAVRAAAAAEGAASFARHYEDAARIIQHEAALPPIPCPVAELALSMLAGRQMGPMMRSCSTQRARRGAAHRAPPATRYPLPAAPAAPRRRGGRRGSAA